MATTNRQATPDILGGLLRGAEGTGLQRLALAQVRRDGGTQPRAGVSEAHVRDLVADLQAGAELPPVDVTYDGTDYWLWDGYHRVEAWRRVGRADVDARVHQGNQADAQWASYGANKGHGLRRTNEDKQRAVVAALKHAQGATRSNRDIARYLGVDEGTVRHWREKLEAGAEIPPVTQRTGADGKVYETAGIGAQQQQQAAAPTSMAELQALIGEWAAERWPGAWPENPSHTNGTFWQALTKHLRGNGVTWRDGDLKMAIQQMAALRQAPSGRTATLDACIAAVWVHVKERATSPQDRLWILDRLNWRQVQAGLAADVTVEAGRMTRAIEIVTAEVQGEIEHARQKEARRVATGGGGGSAPTQAQVQLAFAAWLAATQPTLEQLHELRQRWTAAALWTPMLAAVMAQCNTVVGIKTQWLEEEIAAALAAAVARRQGASVAQPGPAEPEPAETAAIGDKRAAELHRLKLTFMHCMDSLTLWSETTGRYTEVNEAKRGLRRVIDVTSALIEGKAGMDGASEEVTW